MTEFKTELQNLIDEAAELELGDHYYVFKRGANFLMPLIDTILSDRNVLVKEFIEGTNHDELITEMNKALLNLLRGEK